VLKVLFWEGRPDLLAQGKMEFPDEWEKSVDAPVADDKERWGRWKKPVGGEEFGCGGREGKEVML